MSGSKHDKNNVLANYFGWLRTGVRVDFLRGGKATRWGQMLKCSTCQLFSSPYLVMSTKRTQESAEGEVNYVLTQKETLPSFSVEQNIASYGHAVLQAQGWTVILKIKLRNSLKILKNNELNSMHFLKLEIIIKKCSNMESWPVVILILRVRNSSEVGLLPALQYKRLGCCGWIRHFS